MAKKLFHRLLALSIAGALIALVTLLLLFASSRHSIAQSTELTIGPDLTSPGSTVMVSGFNYPANQTVAVYFQDHANGVVYARADAGGFFSVPLTMPRRYISQASYVYAVNGTNVTKAQVNFVKPSLVYAASPLQANQSSRPSIIFHGAGFIAHEQVNVALNVDGVVTNMGAVMTDSQGHFTIPLASPAISADSDATLIATDSSHLRVSRIVPHNALITVNPTSGRVGTTVRITGIGFGRYEPIKILFQGQVVKTYGTSHTGSFTTTFTVPGWASISPFYNAVRAYGIRTRISGSASFQVLPYAALSPSSGRPGQSILALGSQFSPRGTIEILLAANSPGSSVGGLLATFRASSHGTFDVRITIPGDVVRGNVYSIVVIDVTTGLNASTSFRVR